ncbi:hypothetical protein P170DRAFT_433115 [Aspergillus steynii IBT 23096]|uniref:Zn(2)-C6 fungal-type domain-containing protein n=1 Tax=Aspergillus steynii IBT 23096 TaxID=1392250 RepID=A0A2I2GRW0_9EURO|nr:uncharacterized protein P170DRAFT_433115 [Aspergillus steynii IBT 23096]PLB55605.1 hypothetical protein P170DRAFT_433115 [Aspergillus steynii IBT 23096]
MRPQLTKRACDECISRKVKCSGAWPCQTCQNGAKRVRCTYLKPARRRGPKVRRRAGGGQDAESPLASSRNTHGSAAADPGAENEQETLGPEHEQPPEPVSDATSDGFVGIISPSTLASVVRLYRQSSYGVWPVVNAPALLRRIESARYDVSTYCLAAALCAATMAQLQLGPVGDEDGGVVDCAAMAAECMRVREETGYRENPDLRSVFVSFFLHVYHAKTNRQNSAMMFIQEAISGARLLRLDAEDATMRRRSPEEDVIENDEILFILLWVSERGYAIHLGLAPSYTTPIRVPSIRGASGNIHVQGLVELARLFATFDGLSVRRRDPGKIGQTAISADSLAETEAALSVLSLSCRTEASSRMADHCITKEWMRTIVWQEALSRQLLSTASYAELLTFKFPALVSRDLLYSLREFTESDLLPLGRDQLLKCFEVANSLADTVLFASSSNRSFQLRPEDYLHALYQKLLPFLDQDPMLKSILRAKTAEALVLAPARLPEIAWQEDMLRGDRLSSKTDA